MSLQALTHVPALRKEMFGTALTIRSQELDDVTLKGIGPVVASGFAEEVKETWPHFNLAALAKEAARLNRAPPAGGRGHHPPETCPRVRSRRCWTTPALWTLPSGRSRMPMPSDPRSSRASHPSASLRPPREQHGRMPSPPSSWPNRAAGRKSSTRSRASRWRRNRASLSSSMGMRRWSSRGGGQDPRIIAARTACLV